MEIDKEYLIRLFEKYDYILTQDQVSAFCRYYELLNYWNDIHNLTTITEWEAVCRLHFLDSIIALPYIKGGNVIDIGAGAGFPSIPLAIMSDHDYTAVDSSNKKVDFMNLVASDLGLTNFSAIHGRAEELLKTRKDFDYALSRGVASLNTLCEYCLPYVRVGGTFVAYKSRQVSDELRDASRAISLLGGVVREVPEWDIMGQNRALVLIDKVRESPSGYPRGGNKPRTKPL